MRISGGSILKKEYKRISVFYNRCDVIGFCTDTNTDLPGHRKYYNDMLNGTNGRQFSCYDSELNLVKTIKAATNGYTVKSTIDVNVQGIMEQHIQNL